MKEVIDLEDILRKVVAMNDFGILTMPICIRAMKVACEKTVDLCAENAEASVIKQYPHEISSYSAKIDKQSILKIKNKIL